MERVCWPSGSRAWGPLTGKVTVGHHGTSRSSSPLHKPSSFSGSVGTTPICSPTPSICSWGKRGPLNLLNGEPVATKMLHSVYVIVAEEAQADLTEGAGWHHLCHSHLQGEKQCQEGSQPSSPKTPIESTDPIMTHLLPLPPPNL